MCSYRIWSSLLATVNRYLLNQRLRRLTLAKVACCNCESQGRTDGALFDEIWSCKHSNAMYVLDYSTRSLEILTCEASKQERDKPWWACWALVPTWLACCFGFAMSQNLWRVAFYLCSSCILSACVIFLHWNHLFVHNYHIVGTLLRCILGVLVKFYSDSFWASDHDHKNHVENLTSQRYLALFLHQLDSILLLESIRTLSSREWRWYWSTNSDGMIEHCFCNVIASRRGGRRGISTAQNTLLWSRTRRGAEDQALTTVIVIVEVVTTSDDYGISRAHVAEDRTFNCTNSFATSKLQRLEYIAGSVLCGY